MHLKIKLLLFSTLLALVSIAQDSTMLKKQHPKSDFWDKFYTGGNLGVQFGTVTFIDISPLIGYKITDRISAGVGATYQYYQYHDKSYDLKTNVYGGRVFGRYFFTDNIFAHAEYEYLNLEAFDFYPRRRVDVGSLMAGGGYVQHFGEHSGIVAMILYNFTESVYTPYQNPIIRIGVNFGL